MSRSMLWGSLVVAAVAAGWLAESANADEVAPPKRAAEVPPATKKFVVKMDPSLKVSKLILPAGLAGAQPGAKPAANKGAFWSPTRTMLAGLCLSLAVASLIFVRSTSGGVRMLLIAVTGLSALGLGAAAWANAPPPPGVFVDPVPPPFMQLAEGQVQIETGPADGPITLIIAASAIAPPPKLPGTGNAPPGAGPPANPPVQPKPAK